MGDKINARNLMHRAGVPVALGSTEPVTDAGAALAEAERIGYPVMVKAAASGGGIGMSAAVGPEALQTAFETARTRAERFFGSPAILLERFVERARHVEVQIMGLADGRVVALGERDCSVQRRHQKVAEETPSPGVSPQVRERLLAAGVRAGGGGRLPGRRDRGVPARRQDAGVRVPGDEHPAAGRAPGDGDGHRHRPGRAAVPGRRGGAGRASTRWALRPRGTRWNSGSMPRTRCGSCPARARSRNGRSQPGPGSGWTPSYEAGNTVTPFYDPLLAKLCVHGRTRDEALGRAREAVAAFRLAGPKTQPAVPRGPARERGLRQRRLRHVRGGGAAP